MVHPLYHKCLKLLNQPVTVYYVDGRRFHGILQHVTKEGIYVLLLPRTASGYVSEFKSQPKAETADKGDKDRLQAGNVYWGGAFFVPFAALAGLTLGFALGAAATTPYYYPYRYPYIW